MKLIVFSGANILSGGPLTIYNDALRSFSKIPNYKVIAIVSRKDLFFSSSNIEFIEIPNYKRIIFLKFYYEYYYYSIISKREKPDIWISLNDFTPNVRAEKIFTYFHNATIFFKIKFSDLKFSQRAIFQKIYYRIFLRFNINKNNKFIVQQNWIANGISKIYSLPNEKMLVFRPEFAAKDDLLIVDNKPEKFVIFYPTRSYGYKNIELICEAVRIIYKKYNINNIELRITIGKNENNYSKYINKKYWDLPIIWLGQISKSEVEKNYAIASTLVFPSRLETWGLPLTEFAKYKKPILAVDLPYVYDTMRDYKFLATFKLNDVQTLVILLRNLIEKNEISFFKFADNKDDSIEAIDSWDKLLLL